MAQLFLFAIGAALTVYGVSLLSVPAAFIIGGLTLVWVATRPTRTAEELTNE